MPKEMLERNSLLYQAYGLVFIGLLLLLSASKGAITSHFQAAFLKQVVWILIGTVGLIIARRGDYRGYRRGAFLLYTVFVFLLILVLIVGQGRAGRWIRVGWFAFQPSEFAKFVSILMLASFLAERDARRIGYFVGSIFLMGIPFLLILKQPNLGTSFIFLLITAGMLFQAGASRKHFVVLLTIGVLLSPVLWFSMASYQRDRILTFLAPQKDPLGRGYNLLQSKITIGSGGIIGKGFLKGTQTKLAFLPEYHTDFIFCVLAEEFGFLGVMVFLWLYYVFLRNILSIVSSTRDQFAKLVGVGIFVMFFMQAIINISMTLGLFPVAGIPLPFLSYGGSFMIVALFSVGILLNIKENETFL